MAITYGECAGAGASFVLGIDPSLRYLMQFLAARHFLPNAPVHLLPLRAQDLPVEMGCFDTVFSMGVLYHHREPLAHLAELRGALVSGGQLVLESMVIDGGRGETLTPSGRYAQMRNVWQIPATGTLEYWLEQAGFSQYRCRRH